MAMALMDDGETEAAIMRAWQCLPRLRRLSFRSEPGAASRSGWAGCGDGWISVSADGDDWLMVEQLRFWPAGSARSLPCRNTYRWQWAGDRLRLYHERFGAGAAVFLFDLVAAGRGRLVCNSPHPCGKDDYRATLVLTEDGFELDWSISGPRKDEHIHYRYWL